jgi:Bacterial Ig-like domain (group 3)/PKD domain
LFLVLLWLIYAKQVKQLLKTIRVIFRFKNISLPVTSGTMKISRFILTLLLLFVLCESFSTENRAVLPLVVTDSQLNSFVNEEQQNPALKKLQLGYTTSHDSNQVTPIDLKTGTVGTPIVLQQTPKAIILSPDAKIAYIFSEGLNQILPIDLVTKSILSPILLEQNPQAMAITSDGGRAYIIHEASNQVTTIELATGATHLLMNLDNIPIHLSLAPDNQTLYIIYQGSNEVIPIDLTSLKPQPSIFLNKIPHAFAINPKGKALCVGQYETNELNFHTIHPRSFDESWMEEGASLNLENKIHSISLSADGLMAYLTHENSNEITPIDLTTQTVYPSIHLDHSVQSLTLFPKQELEPSFFATLAPAGQSTIFDASATKFFRGSLVDYLWDFGDGHCAASEIPVVHHTYELSGPFNVSLEVTESIEDFPLVSFAEGIINNNHPFKAKYTQTFEIPQRINPEPMNPSTIDLEDQGQVNSLMDSIYGNGLLAAGILPTTTTLISSLNPSEYSQVVTFTATVSGEGAGTPTGIVVFNDGTTAIGTGNLDPSGIATFSISTLEIGLHPITANYEGDTNFAVSTSDTLTQEVDDAVAILTFTSSANPSVFGQTVTLTATLSSNDPSISPTGTVTISDEGVILGTVNVINNVASLNVSNLSVGNHIIDAAYNGDTRFAPTAPMPITQVVNAADVTVVLSSSSNPSVVGQSINFTAQITVNTPGSGTPSGTVTFTDGATVIGTTGVTGGIATITTSSLTVAGSPHSIVATYNGDANFNSAASPALSQVVSPGTTSTALSSSSNPAVFGQSVTLTATVQITQGIGTLSGSVVFFDGGTAVSGAIPVAGGIATFVKSNFAIGSHTLTAVYSNDPNFSGSTSPNFTQVINQSATTTTVTSSVNPSVFDQSVTFTATVAATSPGTGTPTGTVTFFDGATAISGALPLTGGVATFSTSNLSVGVHSITARYGGTGSYAISTSPILSQTVNQGTTSTTLTSSLNPSAYGQPVTFTATIAVTSAGPGTPTGTVTFKDGATTIGTGNVTGGVATFTMSSLSVATHSITAVYNGDTNFQTSTSAVLNQVINQATPLVTLSSSLNPAPFGTTVTFTVNVAAPTTLGLPSGTVTFLDGTTVLGTKALTASGANSSTATLDVINFNAGTHPITVSYSGDANFLPLTSNTVNQVVTKATNTTTITFSNSPNPTEFGQPVVFRVTVTGSVASPPFPPTGTVTFFDGGVAIPGGTVPVSQLLVNSSTALFNFSGLTIGSHNITATYNGDINYPVSTSPILSHSVIQTGTATVLTTSVNPAVFGQTITFSAVVSGVAPGQGAPTGQVQFYNGSVLIGTGTLTVSGPDTSIATVQTSALTIGSHAINAVYTEDPNFTSSTSNLITQVVVKDATNSTVTSSLNPSEFDQNVTFTATIAAAAPGSGTPSGTVQFFDGSTLLATRTLVAGTVTFSTIALTPGSHNITTVYSGDTRFITSTSPILTQVVNSTLPTVTTITSGRNSSPTGQPVNFSATITALTGIPNGGTVTFFDGGVAFGTGTVINGVATVTEPGSGLTTIGTHNITASFGGNSFYDPSNSANFQQFVVPYDTTTVLTSTPNPSIQAGATFTATVTKGPGSPGGPLPGTVTFYNGTTPLTGVFTFDPVTGVATLKPDNLQFSAPTLSVVAVYSGDTTTFASSISNVITQQVQQTDMLTTATMLTTSLTPSYICQPIVLQATVVATQGFYTPTGTVTFFSENVEIGGATLDQNGVARLPISDLPVGVHTIRASYNSDSNYAFSFSNTITQTILANNTTTALSVIPSLPTTPYSQSLIFVTTVTPSNGIASGTVTLSSELGTIETVTLDDNGQAIFEVATLPVGAHTITATFNPDTCYGPSSNSISITIRKVNPSTTLTSQPNPSNYGDPVTLYATVLSPGIGMPTGTVTFFNGSTTLGTVTLNNGEASFIVYNLPAGTSILEATYSGDNNFIATNLPSVIQNVNKAPTTTQLVSFTESSEFGENVTLSATISSTVQQPTGTVTFRNGSVILGIVPLNGYDTAILNTNSLTIGANALTATYNGDNNFLTSVSNTLTQDVILSNTTTSVTSSSPNPSTFGSTITFNVNVSAMNPGAGIPTGTVTGFYGSTVLGTVNLTNGNASFTTSTLPAGVQTIIFKYSGNTNFSPSQSLTTQTVNTIASTTTVTSSSNPSVFGQSVVFTATVASSGTPLNGTVSFLDGTTTLGTRTLNGSHSASLTISTLALGTHPITVVYSGNANITSSTSAILNQVVNKANTTTTVATINNPSFYGQPITINAQVSAVSPASGMPTGTVTFKNGAVTLGSVNVDSTGNASFTIASLPTATDVITAVYNGDTNFNTSTSIALNQIVSKSATIINATASPNPSTLGQLVNLTVNVTPIDTAFGFPSGAVQAFYGSTLVGSSTLDGSGSTTFSLTNLPAGTLGIYIQYLGDGNYLPSSKTISQTVIPLASSIGLTSSVNPSNFGQSVTFTATITIPTGTPTGTVSFLDGTRTIGLQTLNGGNTAVLTTSTLAFGSHSITAVYSGTQSITGSTSPVLTQVVNKTDTVTALSSTQDPSTFGTAITLIANVLPVSPGSGNPTGFVIFTDVTGGNSTVIGTTSLNNSGQAILTISSLPIGSNLITATYNNDANFNGSTSNTINQIVEPAPTIIQVIATPNPVAFGESVTLNISVTPVNGIGTPTGTVNAFYGSTLLGTAQLDPNGDAIITVMGLPAGTSGIVVNYLGDGNYLPSTTNLTQTVNQAASTTNLTSASPNPSAFGQTLTFTATVTSIGGLPTGTVAFLDGSTTIATQTLNASGVVTVNVSNLAISPPTHAITAVYSGNQNIAGSTSAPINQVITKSATNTLIFSSVNPSFFGQTIDLYGVVTGVNGNSAIPTGTVTLTSNGVTIGSITLDGTGQGLLITSTLPLGTNLILGTYSGDVNYNASSSPIITQVVNQSATITNIVTPTPAINVGQSVTATVQVIPVNVGSGSPTGTVQAYYGSILLGSGAINPVTGEATLTLTGLPAGTLAIEMRYTGDTNYVISEATLTQTVNPLVSSLTLTVPAGSNPSVIGQPVTFTATIPTVGGIPPTGSIVFTQGSTVLGTQPLNGSGVATLTLSNLPLGTTSVVASYAGDVNYAPTTSAALNQVVNPASTTAILTAVPTSSGFGDPVTLIVTVTPNAPGAGNPTGTVTFSNGSTVLGTASVNSFGQALLTVTDLPAGNNSLTATYSGSADGSFAAATTAPLAFTVAPATTITTITSSTPNPSVFGQNVVFFANVTSAAGIPNGTVTFFDGANFLGTVPLYNGEAIFQTASLAIGVHSITAVYSGNSNFSGSTSTPPYAQTVNQTAVTDTSVTTLTSSPNPSNFGELVDFEATVSGVGGTPTGFVTLYFGSTPLTTLTLIGGHASYLTSNLPAGDLQIVALYSGDANYSASTTAIVQTVLPINTATTLVSSLNPSTFGDSVTFTATVTTTIGVIPTGTVTFSDGSAVLETVLLSGTGIATYTTSSLIPGSHLIQATYNPDPNFDASSAPPMQVGYNLDTNFDSSSASLMQVVNQGTTTTAIVTSSPNPSNLGDPVTFIASTLSIIGQPTGTVTFFDGTTPLGSVPLTNGLAIFTTSGLSLGSHSIQAVYGGSATFSPSTSLPFTQTVEAPFSATTITLASSPNPSFVNQGVNLTAAITSPAGIPTGTVTFFDGSTAIATVLVDSNGIANFSTSTLAVGSHSILAVYNGDGRFANATSSIAIQVVNGSLFPNAPQNFRGCQVANKFLNRVEHVNILHWDAPSNGNTPLAYRIYRNAELTDLVAEVSSKHLKYEDRDRNKKRTYAYYIVAVNAAGISPAVSTIVYPKNKCCQVNGLLTEEVKWMLEDSLSLNAEELLIDKQMQ